MAKSLDKTWHLAESELEIELSEVELSLWRVYYSFARWQEDCQKCVPNGHGLNVNEIALLHIIRMKDKPKTVYEIGRLWNRDDTPNILYIIRKLVKLKLIEKFKSADSPELAYRITESGLENTQVYTELRKNILIELFKKHAAEFDFPSLAEAHARMNAIYDEAGRKATAHKQ